MSVMSDNLKPQALAPPSSPKKLKSSILHYETLYSDKVFNKQVWRAHTSYARYLPEPVSLGKAIVSQLYPLTMVLLIAIGCGIYEDVIRDHQPSLGALSALQLTPTYSICGFALSLLLVFKSNAAYARFWEARSACGVVFSYCQLFMLKAQAYLPDAAPEARKFLLRWLIALPYLMRGHLMEETGSDSLHDLLNAQEVSCLAIAMHPPASVLSVQGLRTQAFQHLRALQSRRAYAQCPSCCSCSSETLPIGHDRLPCPASLTTRLTAWKIARPSTRPRVFPLISYWTNEFLCPLHSFFCMNKSLGKELSFFWPLKGACPPYPAVQIEWLSNVPEHGSPPNQPLLAASVLATFLQQQGLSDLRLVDMVKELDGYLRSVGMCEKISKTPIPLVYSRHTTRFVLVYVAFLPLALWSTLGWATVPVAVVLTLLLAGIENIGVQMENPVMRLPMAAYCAGIHKSIMGIGEAWAASTPNDVHNFVRGALRGDLPAWQHCSVKGDVPQPCQGVTDTGVDGVPGMYRVMKGA